MPTIFPLNLPEKENYPPKVIAVQNINPKYYETAEEKNKKTAGLKELDERTKVLESNPVGGKFIDGTDTNDAVYLNGKVGNGTPTPTAKEEIVNTDAGLDYFHISDVVGGNGNIFKVNKDGNIELPNGAIFEPESLVGIASLIQGMVKNDQSDNHLKYYNGSDWVTLSKGKFVDGVNPDDAVYTEGDVGIGIDEPQAKTHIKTTDVTGKGLLVENTGIFGAYGIKATSIGNPAIIGESMSSTTGAFRAEGNSGFVAVLTGPGVLLSLSNANGKSVVTSNHELGVGVNIPKEKLDVAGSAKVKGLNLEISRNTTGTTINKSAYQWNGNTDAGGFPYTLPIGVQGETYKIVNTGTSGNTLTIIPNGSEKLIGTTSFELNDGESLIIGYDATDGWY